MSVPHKLLIIIILQSSCPVIGVSIESLSPVYLLAGK
jgi:hypothetical protein